MIESKKLNSVWSDLATNQKRAIAGIMLLIVVAVSTSWINTFVAWNNTKIEQSKRAKAEKDADKALKSAAKIAGQLKKQKAELAVIEEKKSEKKDEVQKSKIETNNARDDYDRAVSEPRTDDISTDELCDELKELGYPCEG